MGETHAQHGRLSDSTWAKRIRKVAHVHRPSPPDTFRQPSAPETLDAFSENFFSLLPKKPCIQFPIFAIMSAF